ncbi:MAG: amidohydrolase [Flavobacteriaceae bacterium]|nr:MAG: amidohydrolase [Flavobacteriaceae bacterium]
MQNELNIASLQVDIIWENPQANIEKYSAMIDSISDDVDLVILPEMFATGFSMNPASCAETVEGFSISWMQEIAKEKQVAIMGTLAIKENNNFYNRLVFVHPNGETETNNKRHLFSYGGEDKVYTQGEDRIIINYKGWKINPMICYDLRFPVWTRNTNDYDVLIFMANWPKPRINAWDTLLKARAIENMCYTIGVNRVGIDGNNLEYIGHSQTIDMLGNVVSDSVENKEMIFETTLNKKELDKVRNKFRFLEDRDFFEVL